MHRWPEQEREPTVFRHQMERELLRRTAGDPLWAQVHPQAEPPAQIDQARMSMLSLKPEVVASHEA